LTDSTVLQFHFCYEIHPDEIHCPRSSKSDSVSDPPCVSPCDLIRNDASLKSDADALVGLLLKGASMEKGLCLPEALVTAAGLLLGSCAGLPACDTIVLLCHRPLKSINSTAFPYFFIRAYR
jgi:hypothetical protein